VVDDAIVRDGTTVSSGTDPAAVVADWRRKATDDIGGWRIQALIGSGAWSDVYLVAGLLGGLPRRLALKVIQASGSPDAGAAVLREAQALSEFQHPHLMRSLAAWQTPRDGDLAGAVVFLLPLAELSLADYLRDRTVGGYDPCDPAAICRAAAGISSALAYLHSSPKPDGSGPVVHNDVKPENLLRVGGTWLLGDLGIASPPGREGVSARAGSLPYLAPEYLADARCGKHPEGDVRAFGVVLHEWLTGEFPFPGDTALDRADAVREGVEPCLGVEDPGLRALISAMIAREPQDRPSAAEVSRRLRAAAGRRERRPRLSVRPVIAAVALAMFAVGGLCGACDRGRSLSGPAARRTVLAAGALVRCASRAGRSAHPRRPRDHRAKRPAWPELRPHSHRQGGLRRQAVKILPIRGDSRLLRPSDINVVTGEQPAEAGYLHEEGGRLVALRLRRALILALILPFMAAAALTAPAFAAEGGAAAPSSGAPSAFPHYTDSHVTIFHGTRASGGVCHWRTGIHRKRGEPPIAISVLSVNVTACQETVRIGHVIPRMASGAGKLAPALTGSGSGTAAAHAPGRAGNTRAPAGDYCIYGGYDDLTWYDPVGLVMNDTTAQNQTACFNDSGYANYCYGYYTWSYGVDGWYINGGPSYNTFPSGGYCYNTIFINYENDIFCAANSTYVYVPNLEYDVYADGSYYYYYDTYTNGSCSGLLHYVLNVY
jgi:hypothetical protein